MRPFLFRILSLVKSNPMIIKVDTTKAGSASTTFVLPLVKATNEVVKISWGDGTSSLGTTGNNTHVYSSGGIYNVIINTPILGNINFNNAGDKLKIMDVLQWGNCVWRVLANSFFGCSNLVVSATDQLVSTATGAGSLFRGTAITKTPSLKAPKLNSINDLTSSCSQLVTALKVTNLPLASSLVSLYANCASLTSAPLYDTSAITNFSTLHFGNTALKSTPLYNMRAATSAVNMFGGTTLDTTSYSDFLVYLATLPLQTGVSFHGGSSKYNTAGATARAYLISTFAWTIADGGAV